MTDWFALYAIDEKIDDETYCNKVRRGEFRLHQGSGSKGCITIVNSDFQSLRTMLKKKTPSSVSGSRLLGYGKRVVTIRVTLIGLWVLLISFFLARWRLSADAGCLLPDLPLSFWMALYVFFNAHGCESGRSVTVNVVIAITILIVSTITWLWHRIKKR